MTNNSNPHDVDGRQVRNKTWENDVVRATVLDVLPESHAVRVNPRGDDSPLVAPVLTSNYNSQMLPQQGTRVTLLYITENVPVVVGGVYLTDGKNPPSSDGEDVIIGNNEGYLAIRADGSLDTSEPIGDYSDEDAQDAIAALLEGGNNITTSYDDANNTLAIDTSALDEEEVEDAVSTLLTGGTGVSLSYDDGNDVLEISGFSGDHADLTNIQSDQHHARYTDSEAQTAINNDADHGSTASHNYFSGDHADLTNVLSDQHHTKTTSQNDLTDFSSDSQNIYVQDTEPSNPSENDIWIDTS